MKNDRCFVSLLARIIEHSFRDVHGMRCPETFSQSCRDASSPATNIHATGAIYAIPLPMGGEVLPIQFPTFVKFGICPRIGTCFGAAVTRRNAEKRIYGAPFLPFYIGT